VASSPDKTGVGKYEGFGCLTSSSSLGGFEGTWATGSGLFAAGAGRGSGSGSGTVGAGVPFTDELTSVSLSIFSREDIGIGLAHPGGTSTA